MTTGRINQIAIDVFHPLLPLVGARGTRSKKCFSRRGVACTAVETARAGTHARWGDGRGEGDTRPRRPPIGWEAPFSRAERASLVPSSVPQSKRHWMGRGEARSHSRSSPGEGGVGEKGPGNDTPRPSVVFPIRGPQSPSSGVGAPQDCRGGANNVTRVRQGSSGLCFSLDCLLETREALSRAAAQLPFDCSEEWRPTPLHV